MKGVQCYELFGGIALKNHAFCLFEDILVSFILQRLIFIFDHCPYVNGLALLLIC